MNQGAGDGSLLDTEQQSGDSVIQNLIETTDNSISNSWTILSTSDEPSVMEADNSTLGKEDVQITDDANSNSVVEQQQDSVSTTQLNDVDKSTTESWLELEDINKPDRPSDEAIIEKQTLDVVENVVGPAPSGNLPSEDVTSPLDDKDVSSSNETPVEITTDIPQEIVASKEAPTVTMEEAPIVTPEETPVIIDNEEGSDVKVEKVQQEDDAMFVTDTSSKADIKTKERDVSDEAEDWVDILGISKNMIEIIILKPTCRPAVEHATVAPPCHKTSSFISVDAYLLNRTFSYSP